MNNRSIQVLKDILPAIHPYIQLLCSYASKNLNYSKNKPRVKSPDKGAFICSESIFTAVVWPELKRGFRRGGGNMQKANSLDLGFIKRAVNIVVDHLDQEKFSGNALAEQLSLSREQTHRKLKRNVSLSTGKFIRFIRLLRACVYLIEGSDTIAEISFKVGFSSPSY